MQLPVSLLALASLATPLTASPQGLDGKTRVRVIESICAELDSSYVFPKVATLCAEHLRSELNEGKFDSVTSAGVFADRLTTALQSVSHDKHLRVRHQPGRAQVQREDPRLAALQQRREQRGRNYGFQKLERLDGNVGYLDLRGFADVDEGRETAAAAMAFLANSDAIIFDLRSNGGGSPEMVQFLCSYLFEERTHLNSLYWRPTDVTEEYWTLDSLPGKRVPEVPVYVLTSSRTFSAAEEFSYNLRTQGRATLVGETTGGGAHPGGTNPIGDGFLMFVPSGRAINPITGTNWEGVGVEPHMPVRAADALDTALADARGAARDFRQYKADELAAGWEEMSAQLQSAEACFKQGEIDDGTELLEAALDLGLELELHNGVSINALGVDYLERNELDAGLAALRFNADMHPESARAWDSLGDAHLRRKESKLALAAFEKCLKLDPRSVNALRRVKEMKGG